jgi:hypothetical protein
MWLSRTLETLAENPAADPPFCDAPANLHTRLQHELDLERAIENADSGLSAL